jgi:hypothetical protein
MAYRRNFESASSSAMRRKVMLLIGCLVAIPLLVYLIQQQYPQEPVRVDLEMLSNNRYIVQGDATNFDNLASSLREVQQQYRSHKHGYELDLTIAPDIPNTDTLRAVIQIISALDVRYTIKK